MIIMLNKITSVRSYISSTGKTKFNQFDYLLKTFSFWNIKNYTLSSLQLHDSILEDENKILSRKSYLISYYKHLNETNDVILFLHHGGIGGKLNQTIRLEIKKVDGKLTVINNENYIISLQLKDCHSTKNFDSIEVSKDFKNPLLNLIFGPTSIITLPELNPVKLKKIINIIKKTNQRLILMGAKIGSTICDIDLINKYKDLSTRESLNIELVRILLLSSFQSLFDILNHNKKQLYYLLKHNVKLKS